MSKDIQASTQGLRGIQLLDGLPQQRLEALARECTWRQYDAGGRIISRNANDTDVSFVISGRV
ncbi:MAG: Cyclic nucleotide-binding protein, partial [Ramlibacter sp.]|nr:Cyclic nucleotide-binding protein [Ramlibacter sp.]